MRFFNRELSWLAFNRRVLHQALDSRTPLLERVRFLGIFTSNLDEFFMKRVGGLKRQLLAGVGGVSQDGMTSAQQLVAIREQVVTLLHQQSQCFHNDIIPALHEQGVFLQRWEQLSQDEHEFANDYFTNNVFPVVTPFAVDPGHPFPLLSNLSLSLGVMLAQPGREDKLFARVKVPEVFPQWIRLQPTEGRDEFRFVSLLDMISHNIGLLFPGMSTVSVTPFRITRNADVEADHEDAEDLLELVAEELRQRRFASIVRIEHGPDADPWVIRSLIDELEVVEQDIYEVPGELDYTALSVVADIDLPKLKFERWTPLVPLRLSDDESDMFGVIRSGDLLVHHPYESFSASVERFIETAADDPKVLAIKVTLYRIGDSQSLMDSLSRAAEMGKQVVCLVELKARFDEKRNIYWAQQLEQAGVHVVYGVLGLKTHTKLALIVRHESEGPRCYAHIGTGNYNVQTAKLYTDLSLFTARSDLTSELVELFHYLTGRSMKDNYEHLLVAPSTMRDGFMRMIEQEVLNHQSGRPAGIIAKMNSLEDLKIIQALYAASQVGVPIDLIVRGFCCLVPGVPGLSENINVVSVIGRFLEHSRIFYFRAGAQQELDGRFFIGSADWMHRNLNHRVELITPVLDPISRQSLWDVLQASLDDRCQAWDLHPDGTYTLRHSADLEKQLGTHDKLMQLTRRSTFRGGSTQPNPDYDWDDIRPLRVFGLDHEYDDGVN